MSSSLIECPIKKALCHISFLTKATSWKHIYIYIYIYNVCENKINKLKKYKSLRGPSYFKIYPYSFFGPTTTIFIYTLDYILINKKLIDSTVNCEANTSFESVSSYHNIVTAKIRPSLRRNIKQLKPLVRNGPYLQIKISAINIR